MNEPVRPAVGLLKTSVAVLTHKSIHKKGATK